MIEFFFLVINYYILNSATLLRSPKIRFEGLEMFSKCALLTTEVIDILTRTNILVKILRVFVLF